MLPGILIGLIAGLVCGCIVTWVLMQGRQREDRLRAQGMADDLATQAAAQNEREARQREEIARLGAERTHMEQDAERAANALTELHEETNRLRGQLSEAQTELATVRTTLEAERKSAQEKLNLLTAARDQLSDHFNTLASKALSDNSKTFLSFAKQELDAQQKTATNTLEAKETAITSLLKPVGDALEKLQTATHDLEVKREGAYGKVLAEIGNIQETHHSLRRETAQLIQALRAPKARGNWGQLQLERCIEFAGMVEHASFDLEVFVRGEDTSLRPDCVIHLPNGRSVVIDVKTPFDAFLDAMSSTDETIRELRLADHASRVREHLAQLSAKAYWKQFKDSPDFVVCFLSSEVLFSAALEQDPGLIEFGSNANVILATPTTLIALLKAVAYGWQQLEVTKNAIAIREAGEKLYDKLTTAQDYVSKMGRAISTVVAHYNSLLGCIEGGRGVFAQARRLHDLGIGQEEVAETRLLDPNVRDLRESEWSPSGSLFIAAEVDDDS